MVQSTFLTVFVDKHNVVGAHDIFRLICTNADDSPAIFPNSSLSQDYPRLFDALYRVCRQLALATAKRILNFRRILDIAVVGGKSSRFCQMVCVSLGDSFLFRQQWKQGREMRRRFGAKSPAFPWGSIRSVLLEHEVKLECVSVLVNGVLAVSGGSVVGAAKELEEQCEKKEVRWGRGSFVRGRLEINVGSGKGHSECVTTELNDRVLRHYHTFCNQSV